MNVRAVLPNVQLPKKPLEHLFSNAASIADMFTRVHTTHTSSGFWQRWSMRMQIVCCTAARLWSSLSACLDALRANSPNVSLASSHMLKVHH